MGLVFCMLVYSYVFSMKVVISQINNNNNNQSLVLQDGMCKEQLRVDNRSPMEVWDLSCAWKPYPIWIDQHNFFFLNFFL